MGLEGLASKHRESTYRTGRYNRWIKVKNRNIFARERELACRLMLFAYLPGPLRPTFQTEAERLEDVTSHAKANPMMQKIGALDFHHSFILIPFSAL
jgi:hypothetical protein